MRVVKIILRCRCTRSDHPRIAILFVRYSGTVLYEEVSVVLIGKLFGNPNLIFAKQFHRLRTFVSRSRDGL